MNWTVLAFPTFLKELARLPVGVRRRVEDFAFHRLPATDNPLALPQVQKLKGYQDFYKIRFGDYRLGVRIDKRLKRVELRRVLHRRDIYRRFP